jgi:hypothetical protein
VKSYGGLADDFDLAALTALASSSGVADLLSQSLDVGLDFLLRQFHAFVINDN